MDTHYITTDLVFECLWRMTESFYNLGDQTSACYYQKQLECIRRRLTERPGTEQAVIDVWHKDCSGGTSLFMLPKNLCGAPGCESMEKAPLLCSRCQNVFYCNEACQTS